ncbi:MAG: SGNH/GDSL hydrolase family protein [Anaerolineae bacterium]|nr:SGNH/GDSL hydrolase family protein [Anaerolineae bacterium]
MLDIRKSSLRLIFALFALICGSILFSQWTLSEPILIEDKAGEANVQFWAERRTLLYPGECMQISWSLRGIEAVFINGEPTIGSQRETHCLTPDTLPVLSVIFPGGAQHDYHLPISFFLSRPVGILVLVGWAIGLAGWLTITAIPARKSEVTPLPEQPIQPTPSASDAATIPTQPESRLEAAFQGCLMRVGGLTLLIVFLFLGLEGLLRLYFSVLGDETNRIRYVLSTEEINQLPSEVIPLPGVDYGMSANQSGRNRLGWRGPEIDLPKPENRFRIVAMGASTTYGFTPPDESYPAWLERTLREQFNLTHVEVINAGVIGYTTFNSLVSLPTRVLELEPDLVIIYDATNDVLTRDVPPECYQGMNELRGVDPRLYISFPFAPPLSRSVLMRFLSINLGLERDPSILNSRTANVVYECAPGIYADREVPRVGHDSARIEQNPPVYYERNLRSMIGIAQIHNIRVMLPTWAYWEATTEPGPYWRAAIDEHNVIVRELAAEYDLLTLDYAELAPQDQSFWSDYIHMNSAGSRHQGEAFAAYLVEQGVFADQ